jgi:DNA-binding transcriptional MerR regulator
MQRTDFSLNELAARAGVPERTVRYYIQLGLIDRPEGETRAARYGPRHLEQLLAIRKWQQAGVSLQRIGELLRGEAEQAPPPRPRSAGTVEVWTHVVVAEGVELMIDAGRAQLTADQVRRLSQEVLAAYARVKKERGQ